MQWLVFSRPVRVRSCPSRLMSRCLLQVGRAIAGRRLASELLAGAWVCDCSTQRRPRHDRRGLRWAAGAGYAGAGTAGCTTDSRMLTTPVHVPGVTVAGLVRRSTRTDPDQYPPSTTGPVATK